MCAATRNPSGLLGNRDFLLLWAGQSISELGSAVTTIALPLTAVVMLRASAYQVGLLSAASTVAFLIITLPAGLIVDRTVKRKLMLCCDLGRMVIILSVPVAAVMGVLTLDWLYLVALLAGMLTVFFDVAYQSFLPLILDRSQLMEGGASFR